MKSPARALAVSAVFAVAGLGSMPAAAQESYALQGGAIGPEQVSRGEESYLENCSGCHGEDLHSVVSTAPDLTGPVFPFSWVGTPISEQFDVISTTMPAGEPGSLRDQTYIDIIAYLLSANGVETKEGELPPDLDALSAVTVVEH